MFVVALVLVLALAVLWNVVLAVDYQRIRELAERAMAEGGAAFHTTFIALGSVLFVATIVLLSVLGAQLFSEIRHTRRLSEFIATFTHELNSPLSSIKLFAQTLRDGDVSPQDRRRFCDLILADTERLHGRISNVLRAALVEGPKGLQVARQPVELRGYVEDYLAARRPVLERYDQPVEVKLLPGEPVEVDLDPQEFRHVLDNLVDNAVKYGREAGVRIELAIEDAGAPGLVALEVRDDGAGIGHEDLRAIFDRFGRAEQRVEGARRQGTGLGLWIVRAIVTAHGGSIEARSPGVGEGATFRIELPTAPAPATAVTSTSEESV
jgi:signal transduction histidine kinase